MISVILNTYKRPHLLERQIEAVKNQSIEIKSENIHVWHNKNELPHTSPSDPKVNTYDCNWNTKFFGRFTIPLLLKTPYVAVFDDDTIPQKDWFKNCLETIKITNGILGGSGVILKAKSYTPHSKVGWNALHSDKVERVDLVGHAWFFKQEWAKYFWYEKPFSWDTGEDIMFSYLAQKYGGINTFVPPHPESNVLLWCNNHKEGMEMGNDKHASWRTGNHISNRGEVVGLCIDNGWQTVNNIK